MVAYRFFVFAGMAAALPLNINLGAYSPALVVGKQTISHPLPSTRRQVTYTKANNR